MHSEVKKLIKEARKQGWIPREEIKGTKPSGNNSHVVLYHKDGVRIVAVQATPHGGKRGLKNTRKLLGL